MFLQISSKDVSELQIVVSSANDGRVNSVELDMLQVVEDSSISL